MSAKKNHRVTYNLVIKNDFSGELKRIDLLAKLKVGFFMVALNRHNLEGTVW